MSKYNLSKSLIDIKLLAEMAEKISMRPKKIKLDNGQVVNTRILPQNVNSDGFFAIECITKINPIYEIFKTGYDKKKVGLDFKSDMFEKEHIKNAVDMVVSNNNIVKSKEDEYDVLLRVIQEVNIFTICLFTVKLDDMSEEEKVSVHEKLVEFESYFKTIVDLFKSDKISIVINRKIVKIITEQHKFTKSIIDILK